MKNRLNNDTGCSRLVGGMIVAATLVLLSGCVGEPTKKATPRPQLVCGPDGKPIQTETRKEGEGIEQQKADQAAGKPCLPKGVIEITENYKVEPAIAQQFNNSLRLLKEEKYDEAIRLLKSVTAKAKRFSAPHINLGIAYARTDQTELAEESLKTALEYQQSHPVALNELGLLYRKTGRYLEARAAYESLLQSYPDFLPARKNLGVLCDIYIQDLNCARSQYEEYLLGIPGDEKVKIWLADVNSRI